MRAGSPDGAPGRHSDGLDSSSRYENRIHANTRALKSACGASIYDRQAPANQPGLGCIRLEHLVDLFRHGFLHGTNNGQENASTNPATENVAHNASKIHAAATCGNSQ